MKIISGTYKLTRFYEVWGIVSVLSLLGLLLTGAEISPTHAVTLLAANFLATTLAFMINDVEDSEDDAMDPKKSKRNPISAGIISKRYGYAASAVTALGALLLFATLRTEALIVGISLVVLGFLYSWKVTRLKGKTVIDILSHGYFLAAGILLASYLSVADKVSLPLLVLFAAVYLISIGGDLFNEIRDFEADRKANLKNTASFLGVGNSKLVQLLASSVGYLMVVYVVFEIFDRFNLPALVAGIILAILLFLYNYFFTDEDLLDFDNDLLYGPILFIVTLVLGVSIFV
ncbi:MAG: UbiA family prenyltransferase [Candidatus Dojkabacteria bacterium]